MQDKTGKDKYDRQGIADVFAELYEKLYTSTTMTHEHEHEDDYDPLQRAVTSWTIPETQQRREATTQT